MMRAPNNITLQNACQIGGVVLIYINFNVLNRIWPVSKEKIFRIIGGFGSHVG